LTLTQEEFRSESVHKYGQDDGAGDAGEAYVYGVQVNGRRDYRVASVRIEEGGVVRQSGHYAYRRGLAGFRVLKLLESVEIAKDELVNYKNKNFKK